MVRETVEKKAVVPKPLIFNGVEYRFNTENNSIVVNNINITIVGDYNNPFFAGKEICEALGYRNVKKAFNNVKPKYKSTLCEIKKMVDLETPIFLWPFKKELSCDEGKAVYISEHGAYHLIMKPDDEFGDWLADDVIPFLRRIGQDKQYKLIKETQIMLEKVKKEKEEAEERIKIIEREKEAEKKVRKIAERRNLVFQRIHDSYQERLKTQVFYIVTSKTMAKDNEFKIGGVENDSLLKKRLSMYNVRNAGKLTMAFVFRVNVSSYKQMEFRMKELLAPFRSKRNANTENFNIPFKILKPLVEMVSENYNEEIDKLSGFVKAFLETDPETYLEPEEMVFIDPLPDELDVNLMKTKISDLSTDEIKSVLQQVLGQFNNENIIYRRNIEEVLEKNFVIAAYKNHIWDIAKPLIKDLNKTAKYK